MTKDRATRSRPEARLRILNGALLRLRAALLSSGVEDDELISKLENVLRGTLLTEALADRFLFAVAGSQGAGKTTLVRELYDLDGKWISQNLGRGERVPILVTEHSALDEAQGWLWELGGDDSAQTGALVPRQASPEDWRDATQDRAPRAMVVELRVPAAFFGIEGMGFVLLPGYETVSPSNRLWQELMRRALVASPSAVVVTDQARLATSQQLTIVEDLATVYAQALTPVIAVSRTENLQDEHRRSELRQRAVDVFGVPVERVVLTGVGQDYRAWVGDIREQLAGDWTQSARGRTLQVEQLSDLIRHDLRPLLRRLQRLSEVEASLDTSREYREWLDVFDGATAAARSDYVKQLNDELDRQVTEATRIIDRSIKSGWEDLGERLWSWIQGRSGQLRRERDGRLIDCWNQASESEKGLKTRHPIVIRDVQWAVANRGLASAPSVSSRPRSEAPAAPEAASAAEADPSRSVALPTSHDVAHLDLPKHVVDDARFLAGATVLGESGEVVELAPTLELPETLRIMPAAALESLRLALATTTVRTKDGEVEVSDPDQSGLETALGAIANNRQVLLRAAVAVVGVDILADGNIDSIPALATAVQSFIFGPAVPGTVGAALSTAVAGTLVGAAAAAGLIQYANAANEREYDRALGIVNGARDRTESLMLAQFDLLMDHVRSRIQARLRGYLKVDEGLARRLEFQKAVADANSSMADVLELIGAHTRLA